ncbi:MAG: hypothetical protein ACJ786_39555 [Catenulispora sp.]
MVFLFVLGAALLIAWSVILWPREDPAETDTDQDGRAVTPATRPDSLEGVLLVQLVDGEISRRQYVREMERLAARDDERHPLAVPPETGPADA